MTVSTVGLAPAVRRLAVEGLQVTLAVSLHAPDDELRDTPAPVNTRWPVAGVLDAAWEYAAVTGRRVSIEYAMNGTWPWPGEAVTFAVACIDRMFLNVYGDVLPAQV